MKKNFKLLVLPSVKNISQVIQKFPFKVELTKGNFKDLEFVFQGGHIAILHKGIDLKDFSFVWLSSGWGARDLAYAIKLYLRQSDTPYTYVEKGTSKITDQMIFSLNNISTPDTLFLGHKEVEKSLNLIKKVCGYPLIVKDTKGSRGAHSVFVDSQEKLIEEIKKLPAHKKYLFQRFIPNDYDWGIMVANGQVVAGEKRYACEGEFRNNICKGGTEVFYDIKDIPEQIKQMALITSQALGLSWSRSDIIVDRATQIPYLMEVNRLPGLTSKTSEIEGAYQFLSSQIERQTK